MLVLEQDPDLLAAITELSTWRLWQQLVGKMEGTQRRHRWERDTGPLELDRQEAQIEAKMMADHDRSRQPDPDVRCNFFEGRRVCYVGRLYSMDVCPADVATRIDERNPLVFDLQSGGHADHGHFDHTVVATWIDPGRLNIDHSEGVSPRAASLAMGPPRSGARNVPKDVPATNRNRPKSYPTPVDSTNALRASTRWADHGLALPLSYPGVPADFRR